MNRLKQLRSMAVVMAVFALASCSNGGSNTDSRTENTLPTLQLSDGDVLGNGNNVVRIPASDDTGIASVAARLLRQGQLQECQAELNFSLVANSLLEACLSDQPTCSVDFIPGTNEITVFPPPLYAPIGLEYELSLVDRDGSTTDPVRAVFCFDVGPNEPPTPAADTYQLIYPGFVQRNGVTYNGRCEKADGSDGVLANDDDDEHITNTCLTAELVDLPQFASNLSTFQQSFRSNGGFRYEGLANAPASTTDSFTYRVTDGVNPPSAPIRVEIIFSGENSPPIAANDSFEIAEDTPSQELNVLNNDSDPDALPLFISSVFNGPANGVANIRNGILIDYVPNANFSGQDQFSYTITDSGGLTATANVVLVINGVNDSPVAQNDAVTTAENTAIEIDVLANDSDPEGNQLTISSVANPVNGSAVISGGGKIIYTPDTNYSGSDAFEYTISDGNGGSDTATAVVSVTFVNVAPIASNDTLSIAEGGVGVIDVVANDIDADGDALIVIRVDQPANGIAEVISDTSIRYTPAENFNGTDSFSYTVSDDTIESSAQVVVTVGAVNDLPVAVNDSAGTNENTAVTIVVTSNDTDPDGDSLTVAAVTQPANGTVTITGDNAAVIYTPNPAFSGTNVFGYTVSDGNGGSDTATVTVTVSDTNGPPVANNDTASTPEGTAISIDVLENDTDPDGDALTLSIVQNSTNGSAVVSNGLIVYTPEPGFDGNDVFTYQVEDNDGVTSTAQVTVTVSNVNVSPNAVDDSAGVNENGSVTIDVLDNDSDPDGDTLTITAVGSAANGAAILQSGSVVYTPSTDFEGQDQFSYSISDGNGGVDTAEVTVTVSNVNQPPVAADDAISNEQDDAVSIGVLGNDSDPDGDSISVQSVTQPTNGVVAITPDFQRVVYQPATGFAGVDTFSYTISDGNGATATATVTVTVTSVNVAPVANPDTAVTAENTAITIDVTDNDTDANGDALVLAAVSQPDNGTATVDNGVVVYAPSANFSGTDSFTYTINDGNSAEATGTVTVTVSSTNVDPVARADTATTSQGTPTTIDVLDNDEDADGDTLALAITTQAGDGAATVSGGQITYTPDSGFSGIDTFVYSIDDGNGGVATASVSVTVVAANQPPTAAADTASTSENTAVDITVLSNDSDADSADTLTVAIDSQPGDGSATTDGTLVTYTPDAGFSGTDSFGYSVSDGNGGTDTATVTVTVSAVNAAPVAAADTASTTENTAIDIAVLDNDSDADSADSLTVAIDSQPGDGSASTDGTLVTYTPDAGFSGTDSFGYSVSDGNGGTDTATVTVTVSAVNAAPVAAADTASTTENTAIDIAVLDNDSDADSADSLTVAIDSQPGDGSASTDGTLVTYTPDAGFSGTDSFGYSVSDGNGGTDTATVTVTVTAVNAAPVAAADTASTTENTAIDIPVLDNDSDADSADTLTVAIDSQPGDGSASTNGTLVTYTPDAGFSGTDSFGYNVSDGNGGTDTATVTVTVTAVNAAPVAVADIANTTENTAIDIAVLDNDSDADIGDTLTVAIDSEPADGSATTDGTLVTYTPDAGFSGIDSFGYSVSDGNGGADTATVTVTVAAVNTAPVAVADIANTTENTAIDIAVLDNDSDADIGDTLTVAIETQPADGSATTNGTLVTYTPGDGFSGADSFTYTISDGNGGVDTGEITVNVNPAIAA